ncbi:MAG TPA: hypothetical protein VGO67_04350 [Verrucomicrobiae bacterium]|jgi:hypothetical protein
MNDFQTVVSAILGSSVGSAVVTHFLTSRRAEIEFRRKKLEELWLASDRYCTTASSSYAAYSQVFNGLLDFNQAQDLFIKHMEKTMNPDAAKTLNMVAQIYFPKLIPHVSAVVEAVFALSTVVNNVRSAHNAGNSLSYFSPAFNAAMLNADSKKQSLMTEMSKITK